MNIFAVQRLSNGAAGESSTTTPPQLFAPLRLPPGFPFESPEQLRSCRFWPNNDDCDAVNDLNFLRAVVLPPATTTVRLVVPFTNSSADNDAEVPPERRERAGDNNVIVEEDQERSRPVTGAENNNSIQQRLTHFAEAFAAVLQRQLPTAQVRYFPHSFLDVIFINPRQISTAAMTTAVQRRTDNNNSSNNNDLLIIVVDPGCGEAVLRGGDVFAPGVLAANRSFERGERAKFVCSFVANGSSNSKPPLVGAYVDLAFICNNCVIVASDCECAMSRAEIFKPQRSGIAIKTRGGLCGHPSLGLLTEAASQVSKEAATSMAPIPPFLQNISSMVPAPLLLNLVLSSTAAATKSKQQQQQQQLRILDACAAPGGKSSHILSQCALVLGLSPEDVRLVCVERSSSRAKQLQQLLVQHHGADTVAKCVCVVAGDSNAILKRGTKERQQVLAFLGEEESGEEDEQQQQTLLFDAVLLDPPCTGFGLRPRLRPFDGLDEKAVAASGDYQRKLLSTAAALTRPGGYISYSTCTTSLLENEHNVDQAVATMPLRVVKLAELIATSPRVAATLSQLQACGACRVVARGGGDCAVFRFGPAVSSCSAATATTATADFQCDSVGFFLAMFQRI